MTQYGVSVWSSYFVSSMLNETSPLDPPVAGASVVCDPVNKNKSNTDMTKVFNQFRNYINIILCG